MKKIMPVSILFIGILFSSWGFYAHKLINHSAVFTLPTELAAFYKKHIQTITEKAVDPDKRCYIDSTESPRHYIDVDDYDDGLDSIPIHWTKAKEKYEERKLLARGIVPWQIYRSYNNLVNAFKEKNISAIIRYSADLGHYVSDAHVPLHTTKNYNGQYTDQIGIHAFWESRLPEMFAKDYNMWVGRAEYLEDPLQTAWDIVHGSHTLVDSVLDMEKQLSASIPENIQKTYITRNNILTYNYSDHYAQKYHEALNGMVQRRLRASVHLVGSYWLTAWVTAGQPNLSDITETSTDSIQNPVDIRTQKILGREEWH